MVAFSIIVVLALWGNHLMSTCYVNSLMQVGEGVGTDEKGKIRVQSSLEVLDSVHICRAHT